jgi:serine/threonine protein kinase
MGVVYAAHHLLLDKGVAIKVLSRGVSDNPDHVTRFLNEARLAARIKSPHVCSVMDVGQLDDGRPFLVMELLEGGDLASALRARGPLPIWDIVEIALGALEGIVHAHVRGIVHRDLKPSNLFLASDPEGPVVVKVLDFGISKFDGMNEQLPANGAPGGEPMILGSPAYMSPEQARDARNVDVRSDIWSMGIIMYELATGVCPFDGPTPQDTLAKIRASVSATPAGKLREMPAVLDAAIARCMRRNPDERYPNVLELAQAIAPIRPGSDAAVARIAAVMARPKAALADSSQGLPPVETTGRHATNVSWVGTSGARTNRRAMGLGAGMGVALLLAIGLVVAHNKKKQRDHALPATAISSVTAAADTPGALPLPSVAPSDPAPPPPVPSDPAPPDPSPVAAPSAVPSASSAQPTPAKPVTRPHAPPPSKPTKQELLKDRH